MYVFVYWITAAPEGRPFIVGELETSGTQVSRQRLSGRILQLCSGAEVEDEHGRWAA